MALTQEQLDSIQAAFANDPDIQSVSVGGQTVTRRSLKELQDAAVSNTPVDVARSMGFVKTIPPSPG